MSALTTPVFKPDFYANQTNDASTNRIAALVVFNGNTFDMALTILLFNFYGNLTINNATNLKRMAES